MPNDRFIAARFSKRCGVFGSWPMNFLRDCIIGLFTDTSNSQMHFQTTFAALFLFTGAITGVSASPAIEKTARREMKSSLEKKENCYCYDSDDPTVHCGRSLNFGVSGYCPGGQNRVCCNDCCKSLPVEMLSSQMLMSCLKLSTDVKSRRSFCIRSQIMSRYSPVFEPSVTNEYNNMS